MRQPPIRRDKQLLIGFRAADTLFSYVFAVPQNAPGIAMKLKPLLRHQER